MSEDTSKAVQRESHVPCKPGPEDMLYGVALRPPQFQLINGRFVSSRLVKAELVLSGAQLIVADNFVAVVAQTPEQARLGARQAKLVWNKPEASLVAVDNSTSQDLATHKESYGSRFAWPNRIRWGESPEWVAAAETQGRWTIWAPSNSHTRLRADLSSMLGCSVDDIEVVGGHKTGISRTCADDAAADAALLAKLTKRSVSVLLDEAYQDVVDGLGVAQANRLNYASSDRSIDQKVEQFWNSAPAVALLLANIAPALNRREVSERHWPYDFDRVSIEDGPSEQEAYWDLEQDRLQDVFARETFVDELADKDGCDPIAYRLRHLNDERSRELLASVAAKAGWQPGDANRPVSDKVDISTGRGVACSQQGGEQGDQSEGVRSAWIVDLEVNKITGDITLKRLVVGQDSGPAPEQEFLKDLLQRELLSVSRPLLLGQTAYDQWGSDDSAQISASGELPVEISRLPSVEDSESGSEVSAQKASMEQVSPEVFYPAISAIGNAIHNATGVRFRSLPFSAERIRGAALQGASSVPAAEKSRRIKRNGFRAAAAVGLGVAAMAWPWPKAMVPVSRPAPDLYSQATIERGRLVAEAGDCAVCHTEIGGIENAGGRPFETPFGTVYSSNITPDEKQGIGSWSFEAFNRAMRHGISRDGKHLYPVFPYTAFAKISDGDMQALYAYLMAQKPETQVNKAAEMSFPMSYRPILAGWNTLNHDPKPFEPDASKSDLWNRGAYLAEGLGHCSACHSPRDLLGAEKKGSNYLAGALVDGWEAPALSSLSNAPKPWTEEDLFQYLREGRSVNHGVAGGPMAPVVAGLANLPETDVRAIAHYVASFSDQSAVAEAVLTTPAPLPAGLDEASLAALGEGQRIFDSGCAVCHDEGGLPSLTRADVPLGVNTNLHSNTPDNVIQTILYGVQAKTLELPKVGMMPGFKQDYDDGQVVALVKYLRSAFAPGKKPWSDADIRSKVADYRAYPGTH
ncbi:c-type cytochrome [Marinobacterium lutimaris]|uniref:Nicotinate dehydrogenase subunit B n=1 Tax=Marinobacterium lutimaris TaxID=568106 RepID=A0A1H6DR58_9GAMM|nr:c-type cytochrome [Marinobacterium lutimaris]SEG87196.1 nicotinate dehydrogenase subunit B [Marinobacterium lutimaris]